MHLYVYVAEAKAHALNGLQVNGVWGRGGLYYREFTKSLMFREFEVVLKDPFRYVHLFLLLKSL